MDTNYQIDDVDRKILRELSKNGRMPFLDIAKRLLVSGGTIHQRVGKMKNMGIINGYRPILNKEKLGFGVTALVGIHLKNAKDCASVLDRLNKLPEVLEAHYTTGTYALMIKASTASMQEFHAFLTEKLQSMPEIQSTESFICLATPIERQIKV